MRKLITILLLFNLAYGQTTNFSFTALPFGNAEIRKQGRGASMWYGGEGIDIPVQGAPTPDYDFYWRFGWGDIQNLSTDVVGFGYFDWAVGLAIAAGQRVNFSVMGFYPGDNTQHNLAPGPLGITYGGNQLSYPVSLHLAMQAEPTYKDQTTSATWYVNNNSLNYRARYNHLMDTIITHLKNTTYSGINGWKAVGYIGIRNFGISGECVGFDAGTVAGYGWPSNMVAADTTLIGFCNDIITRIQDKRLYIPVAAFYGSSVAGTCYNSATSYAIMQLSNTVGPLALRRDCFAQTSSFVPSFFENNTSSYNGVNFNTWFLNAYQTRPWYNEPCNCCAEPGGGTGGPPMYYDAPRQAQLYHITSFGNGNYYLPGTAGQVTQSQDSIRLASKYSGYRVSLTAGSIPATIAQGANFPISLTYLNSGIAPPYENWIPMYQLWSGNTMLKSWKSKFNLKLFLPGSTTIIDTFSMSGVNPGTYTLKLSVQDTSGYWTPFIFDLTSPAQNADGSYTLTTNTVVVSNTGAPVANAGTNQTITLPTSSVTLDGTGSTGTISGYAWTQVQGPNTAVIVSPSGSTTSVTGLIQGTYIFQLSVNAGVSLSQVTIVVNPAVPPSSHIFSSQTPAGGTLNDGTAIELGVKFQSTIAGYATGIRFYKTSGNTGTHVGELYNRSGTRLAQATFTGETLTGWQYVTFSTPVAIASNTTYVATYFSPSGTYTSTTNGLNSAIVNTNLTALANGTDGPNGVYLYTATPAFPTSNYQSSDYWVDVTFSITTPPASNCKCHVKVGAKTYVK